jgi:hypothetical protein
MTEVSRGRQNWAIMVMSTEPAMQAMMIPKRQAGSYETNHVAAKMPMPQSQPPSSKA